MAKGKHKTHWILLGIFILLSACAPTPKIDSMLPPPEPGPAPEAKDSATPAAPPVPEEKKEVKEESKEAKPEDAARLSPEEVKETGKGKPGVEMEDDKYIVLNFEDADLDVVMQTITELIGMNYILGPKVKGKITIQTYKKIPRESLEEVLHAILSLNGFSAVKSGHYYKIVPAPEAKQHPILTKIGKDETELSDEDVMVTQIIPLEHISANDVSNIIKPLVSKNGNIITHKETNLLIINEVESNLKRLFKIIDLLDVPTEESSGEKIYVYYVENADASKLANTLNSVYKKQKGEKKTPAATAAASAIQKAKEAIRKKEPVPAPPPVGAPGESLESETEGEINIIADPDINALIVKTTPIDFKRLMELITKLDILPQQVLVEVLIANVTLDNSTKFGLEWATAQLVKDENGNVTSIGRLSGNSSVSGLIGGSGLTYLMQHTNSLRAIISLSASKGNVNILSSPHILTADNKEASINIVDQEPIPKTTITGTSGANNPTQYSYEYKDVGIKLTITPNINEKKFVALKIGLEVSELKSGGDPAKNIGPSFAKRDVNTSLVVQDEQSLIIGGLIKERRSTTKSGIPWLMDIPVLGYLFGSISEETVKNELVLMITPRVINNSQEAKALTDKYEQDMQKLKEIIQQK
ncbi:MAG: hypothetical protein HZA78_04995 [Candidatus Schekmanbacteria bacterium]|nr:hypothetical protein [Candidatus Schekmanbacteria bacterium]